MANFINYTGLTYNDIKSDIMARLAEDSRFANFRESALYSVITEIFAATTDFTNYYIERRAEESFLDSAKLRSSVVLLSKMLGYVITRPIPASANIKIVIKSLPQGTDTNSTLVLKSGTTFTFEGNTYTLIQGLTYRVTQTDINNFLNPTYVKELHFRGITKESAGNIFDDSDPRSQGPISLVQCEQRTKNIDSATNTQMGMRYQTYAINDTKFSNIYGNVDFGYDVSNPNNNDVTLNGTRVAIGTDENSAFCSDMSEFSSKREFRIDRRSFLNNDSIPELSATGAAADVKYCVIRSSMNDGVELLFGDDNVSSIGAKGGNNIYVRYLATMGSEANTVGVMGKSIQCNSDSYENGFDRKNVEFYLTSNITGGSDIEDIESIKINSPEIFYSLERCVTPRDYVSFLKTLVLTSKKVKNAIAWGEQEETREVDGLSNIKLFNVVLFSVLSDMYAKTNDSQLGSIYSGVDIDENILVAPLTSTEFDWFNTIIMSDSVTPLKNIQVDGYVYPELKSVYEKLYDRSQLTVKNVYVAPIIQDFDLTGTIFFNPLIDKDLSKKKIQNAIYSYLALNADFDTNIYLSTLIDIIENFSEVHHADIWFSPRLNNANQTFTLISSGSEVDSQFETYPEGYVLNTSWVNKSKFGTREYSNPSLGNALDIQKNILSSTSGCSAINTYTKSSFESIFCLMPNFEVKSYKKGSFIYSELIWPSSNSYDKDYCSLSAASSKNINTNYYPSIRNLYLGLLKCYMDKLNYISSNIVDNSNIMSQLIKTYDEMAINGKCFCSLKDIANIKSLTASTQSCSDNIVNAQPKEIIDFINNYFQYYVKLLTNTFSYEIKHNMIDVQGNITNFSMKNEIARINLDKLIYSYK